MSNYKFGEEIIKTIAGVPIEVAFSIYITDNWFNNESAARYVKLTIDNYNVKVEKSNTDATDYVRVKLPIQNETQRKDAVAYIKSNQTFDSDSQTFYNICFSVWGNKGPYEYFLKYFKEKRSFPKENQEKQFLAHLFWVLSNDYSMLSDNIVQKVATKMGLDLSDPDLKTRIKAELPLDDENALNCEMIFKCGYYRNYLEVLSDGSLNTESQKNLQMDLDRANLYIRTILASSSQSGGRKKKTKKVRKNKVKGKKSSRR